MNRILKVFLTFVIAASFAAVLTISAESQEKPNGEEIYNSKCSMCHAKDGKGYSALKTPDFTDPKWQASRKDKELLDAIKDGVKGSAMPAFQGKLSDKEILAVLQQIRAFGKGAGKKK